MKGKKSIGLKGILGSLVLILVIESCRKDDFIFPITDNTSPFIYIPTHQDSFPPSIIDSFVGNYEGYYYHYDVTSQWPWTYDSTFGHLYVYRIPFDKYPDTVYCDFAGTHPYSPKSSNYFVAYDYKQEFTLYFRRLDSVYFSYTIYSRGYETFKGLKIH